MGLLQDKDDDYKTTSITGTPITQRLLGFDKNEGSNTGNHTGGNVEGSTSAAKDNGKASIPHIDRLLHSEGNYDIPIIIWFSDVYMIDRNAIFVK